MRVIIAGAGRIGASLAKTLAGRGNEVVVVDIDKERCARLSAEVDALVIVGDATKPETLRDAGADRADVFVAVTDRDEVNVLSCLIARQLGSARAIAKVGDPSLIELAEGLGIERAICPELVTAKLLSSIISGTYGLAELLASGGQLVLVEVAIPPSSPAAGKPLRDLPRSGSWVIVAVRDKEELLKPTDDLELREGMKVVALMRRGVEEEFRKLLAG
ncbi:MAG: NAD-binding protein [Candidatus Nezhaarchaeota archaeon]|nr:NAD-binding protein [Candidatus Nezhaarchaeota archaeon]